MSLMMNKCVHERRDTCLGSSSAPHLTAGTLLGCRLLPGNKKMLEISCDPGWIQIMLMEPNILF